MLYEVITSKRSRMNAKMPNEIESPAERQNRHKAMEAVKVLNALREDYKAPLESMHYFYDLFERVYCHHEALHRNNFV